MSKALVKRIDAAYGLIYAQGDSGLNYMEQHGRYIEGLMQDFYDDKVETLARKHLTKLAESLETIADDMAFDLEEAF
jgi:phage gp16-like protein